MECFAWFCFVVKTSADNMILIFFDLFSHEFSLFSTQLSFYAVLGRKKTEIMCENVKSLQNHVVGRHFVSLWKRRPTTWFGKFLTFSHMNSVFFQPNWVFILHWVEKRLKSCEKMSKICKIMFSPTFCFVVKTSADNIISRFFDTFSHEFSFLQPNTA